MEFDRVCKRFGDQAVLDHLSLSVRPGECVALVGGNGAGKTTTLKILLDFQQGDAGQVRVFGVPNVQTRARERLVFFPERFVPPHHLSGREFLAFMGRLYGSEPGSPDVHLKALDLPTEALGRPVRSYSKGMAQKLGLVACFASGKELMVLDEPMSGLDPKARIQVRRQLARLHAGGHSILFTTHALADAEALAQRLAILCEGRIVFDGSARECCQRFAAETLEEAYLRCVDAAGALDIQRLANH